MVHGQGNYHMLMDGGMGAQGGTGDQNTLNQLASKHDQYADEIQKIRDMLGDDDN